MYVAFRYLQDRPISGIIEDSAFLGVLFTLADEKKLYTANYIGSGTFIISKPKRKERKLRQSRVRSPQRGARK